jgi:uncharacterized membrane protein
MLEKNEGRADRIARAVVGTGVLACSVRRMGRSHGNVLAIAGAIAGATLLFAAATGSCPIYAALGIDTSTQSTGDPA